MVLLLSNKHMIYFHCVLPFSTVPVMPRAMEHLKEFSSVYGQFEDLSFYSLSSHKY